MAIKFGMTLAQVFNQLVKGYQKVRGVEPKGLDLIKIKQEAMQRFQDMRKILDMQGNPIDPSKPIMGGSQQGEAFKSGIMKATGAGPKKVLSEDEIRKKLMGQNKKNLESMREKKYQDAVKKEQAKADADPDYIPDIIDPEDFASGGRAGFKDGEGIMQMASMDDDYEAEFMKLVGEFMENGFSQQEAIDAARDELERLRDKFVSAPDPIDERNELSLQLFKKPIDLLTPEEMDLLNDETERLMQKFSKVDRGAPSITLADGGRAEFKDGLLARMMEGVKPDGGMFKSIFANRNAPFLSGFNTAELFDIVSQISSLPGLADGGRIGYKDGPKDPRRRTFMKAAAGIASMIPLGGAKIIGKAAPVVAKAAEISGPALAKIVDTVMSLGKLISVKGRRVKEMVTKKKHEGVEVTEDIQDGSYIIKKGDKEIYYKPGRQDEMGIDDDIIEVIEKTVTKKAGGGVARLLGE